MKKEFERNGLLDELVKETAARGPSKDAVLGLVRSEKRMRRQRRVLAGFGCTAALMATLSFLTRPAETVQESRATKGPAVAKAAPAVERSKEPFAIKRINDEELLEMLSDQPVALVTLANGEKQLLTVVHDGDGFRPPLGDDKRR